jgi:methylenetetrahydrofolate dehydrogenase (NADP+)/methenyltetrahydrofolate cyclohydrolase
MQTRVFNTEELAARLLEKQAAAAAAFRAKHGRAPTLAVVLVGEDPASAIYVHKKAATCLAHGVNAIDFPLAPAAGFAKLTALVRELNAREDVDGILVQFPLPKGWDEREISRLIDPAKDVDGFHPANAGRLAIDASEALSHGLPPCTPAGAMEVLREAGIDPAGKRAVVIGRSNIVGKPMAQMLLAANATVTICHSRTAELATLCREADILVAALGKAHFVTREFVKQGAVVLDVGINRVAVNGKARVTGDVDAASLMGVASLITPVPKGLGPMTIVMLIRNTVRAAESRNNAKQ